LAATISSPWDQVLRDDLRLPIRPRLRGASTRVRATGWVGWSVLVLVVLAFLVLAAAALLRLGQVRRQPRLVGTLTVYHDGETVSECILRGRTTQLGKGALRVPEGKLAGSVKAVRRRDPIDGRTEHGVRVAVKAGGGTGRGVLWSGQSLRVGAYEVSYSE